MGQMFSASYGPGAPTGMDKGTSAPYPSGKSFKVSWCISSNSKMLSRRIIYALFSKHSSTSESFVPDPIGAPFMDPDGGRKPQTP